LECDVGILVQSVGLGAGKGTLDPVTVAEVVGGFCVCRADDLDVEREDVLKHEIDQLDLARLTLCHAASC
jgi:hypothetical protein